MLDMSSNNITALPTDLRFMLSLTTLLLADNPLLCPPTQVTLPYIPLMLPNIISLYALWVIVYSNYPKLIRLSHQSIDRTHSEEPFFSPLYELSIHLNWLHSLRHCVLKTKFSTNYYLYLLCKVHKPNSQFQIVQVHHLTDLNEVVCVYR